MEIIVDTTVSIINIYGWASHEAERSDLKDKQWKERGGNKVLAAQSTSAKANRASHCHGSGPTVPKTDSLAQVLRAPMTSPGVNPRNEAPAWEFALTQSGKP